MENQLFTLLTDVQQQLDENTLSSKFNEIARCLFNNCEIKKGNITYHFMEIEFYYYSSQHKDSITYPRHADAGKWYFHPSGVDICFESKVELDDETGKILEEQKGDVFYGGILIRSLIKHDGDKKTYITGPLNCCDELFDQFSAFETDHSFPQIIYRADTQSDVVMSSCGRYFKFSTSLEDKFRSILKSHYQKFNSVKQSEIVVNECDLKTFKDKITAKYRFYLPDEFDKREKEHYKNYNAKPSQDNSLVYKE